MSPRVFAPRLPVMPGEQGVDEHEGGREILTPREHEWTDRP